MSIKLQHDLYFPISADMRESLERYLNNGIMPGGFLTAILENNLMEAAGRADQYNQKRLHEYVGYVYNHLPASAWGSPERVATWLRQIRNGVAA